MFKHKGIYLTIFWNKISYSFSYSFTALQNPKLSTSQAQSMVGETVTTSEKLRDDYYFLLSLKEVSNESKQLGIDEPALGQKKKASQRIEDD